MSSDTEITWVAPYRHGWGGRYTSYRYPSGASGCVTKRTPSGPWVVACHPHLGDFPTARAAARAEADYVDSLVARDEGE